MEFARAADPVFKIMAGSRDTITKTTQELHEVVLTCYNKFPFWSFMVDKSTDSATKEQLGVNV